jgi:hypothetical protein
VFLVGGLDGVQVDGVQVDGVQVDGVQVLRTRRAFSVTPGAPPGALFFAWPNVM